MGVYTKKTVTTASSFFDPSLTPQNAGEKGFKYIDDVIYDLCNPGTMIDILEFLREFHGKLGTPTEIHALEEYFGLYIPLP